MQTDIAQSIYDKVRILSIAEQEEVLEIVEDKLSAELPRSTRRRSLMEKIDVRIKGLSPETLDLLPVDGAENLDHYLYGHPRKAG